MPKHKAENISDEQFKSERDRSIALSTHQWLEELLSLKYKQGFIDYNFPTDRHKKEFLENIHAFTEEQIASVIKLFLIPSGSLGIDKQHFEWLMYCAKNDPPHFEKLKQFQYFQRLLSTDSPWEGITWILDLLPFHPMEALAALDAFFMAHAQVLPDGRSFGLSDAMAIIRSRYFEAPQDMELFLSLPPRDFEHIVEGLYRKMGYKTTLTPMVKDGGYDVYVEKHERGVNQKILVECKRYRDHIGIDIVRALLGTISDKKFPYGLIVAPKGFTSGARKFARTNPRVSLVDGEELIKLMNESFGPTWSLNIDRIILESKRRHLGTAIKEDISGWKRAK